MDAKGRAELGKTLLQYTGLTTPAGDVDLTCLQVPLFLPSCLGP